MKENFKTVVLAFLASKFDDKYERFNRAFELYKKTPGKNIGFETKVNRVGYTDEFLESMLYDLKKLNDISDIEVVEHSNKKPAKEVDFLDVDFEEVKPEIKSESLPTDLESSDDSNVEDIKTLPGEEQSLREEFPFLNDEDCPEIMYVVVGKRIAAHKRYESLHALLQQIEAGTFEGTEEQKLTIVQDTEAAFAENRALWEELNYYAEKGEILGKHELFRQNQLKKEVDEMSKEELVKFIPSSATFFSRKKSELAKAKDADKIAKIQLAIEERTHKLKLVNEKLGVSQ